MKLENDLLLSSWGLSSWSWDGTITTGRSFILQFACPLIEHNMKTAIALENSFLLSYTDHDLLSMVEM